jgi:hypothetical protein
MAKFIRVKNKKTGSEYTIANSVALGDDVQEIAKPATNRDGKPLPAKHKTNLAASTRGGNEPTPKAETQATTSKKEQS